MSAIADHLAPPRGEAGSLERYRSRATAITLAATVVAAGLTSPGYFLAGLWETAVFTGLFAGAALMALALFRVGAPRSATYATLTALTALYLVAVSLVERPFDASAVSWTIIIPITGTLLVGVRGAGWGAVVGLGAALIMIGAHRLGWAAHVQGPVPGMVAAARYVVLLTTLVSLSVALELLREQAMAEAEKSARARGLFLAKMSHELRTPMNGVLGLTELVLGGDLQPEQREKLELAQRSGRALVALIDDLLNLTKLESGGVTLEALPFDPRELLADVVGLHRVLAAEKGLQLASHVEPEVPAAIVADPTRLRQVLTNLLGNALKFTEAGTVSVHAWRTGFPEKVHFAVHDTGIGIPPAAVDRLFKAFAQLDETYTRRYGGSGLGLALSRQLALAMQGELSVTSEPGVGCVFTLTLPLERTTAPPVSLGQPARPTPSGPWRPVTRPPTSPQGPVLVVDDNPINLRVARGMVEKLGLAVETATNGREALGLLRTRDYHCVLMDCHMPEMDGYQATRAVRGLGGARAHVPILALTASVMPEDLAACRDAGMDACLAKPVTLDALAQALARVGAPSPTATP